MTAESRSNGIISGQALDVNGEPLALAHVEAMGFRNDLNLVTLAPLASTDTDDRGGFRISGLDPVEYYIRILPPAAGGESYPPTYLLPWYNESGKRRHDRDCGR